MNTRRRFLGLFGAAGVAAATAALPSAPPASPAPVRCQTCKDTGWEAYRVVTQQTWLTDHGDFSVPIFDEWASRPCSKGCKPPKARK